MKTSKQTQIVFSVLLGSILAPAFAQAANATPDYWKCTNKESGEWHYGRAPMVCSANAFGEDRVVQQNYPLAIFKDSASRDGERRRYLGEVHALVREAARVYLKKQQPSVTDAELTAWTRGIVATAAHESYWSHYRNTTDGRLKMMRGDSGHGHGLMQIDDRAHYPVVSKGIAWNLISHVTYAMDIFASAWEKAAQQSCVKSASNYWEARIRSSWSAYNGGPSKLCRWTNPNDRWAQNDKNFHSILSGRRWESYVADLNQKTSVPVACLMENQENCPTGGTDPSPTKPIEGQLYRISDKFCVSKNQTFQCVDSERDIACLMSFTAFKSDKVIHWTASQASGYAQEVHDRHLLCPQFAKIIPVGSAARFGKNINLRETPGGGLIGLVPANRVLQIRDFEVRGSSADRYYKVREGSVEGYVYAGNALDSSSWAVGVPTAEATAQSLARLGEKVRIVNGAGINLRETPGGTLILTIPRETVLDVQEIASRTSENKLYYKVKYSNRTGYIYTGSLLPRDGTTSWTKVVRP